MNKGKNAINDSKLGYILNKTILVILSVFTLYLVYLNILYAAGNKAIIYSLWVIPAVFVIYLVSFKLSIRPYLFFIIVFALAFAAKSAVTLMSDTRPVSDFNTFYNCAVRLVNGDKTFGHGFYFTSFAYQTGPVMYYAAIMKLFGTGLLPLKLVNCLFMAGSNAMIYLIARKISNDYTARFAALLYLLYPAPYFLAPVLTNQHFAACMFLLSLYILLEKRLNFVIRGISAGIIMSVGNVVRPLGIVITGAIVIWAAVECIRKKKLIKAILAMLLLAGYFLTGFGISSAVKMADINPEGLHNNYPLWKFVVGLNYNTLGTFSYDDQNKIFIIQDFKKRDDVSKQVIKERISISKGKLLTLLAKKQKIMWADFDTLRWGFYKKVDNKLEPTEKVKKYEPAILRIEKMYYILAFLLMLLGLVISIAGKKLKSGVLLISVILICYFAAHALIEIQVRYRYFALMLVFILAARGSELLMSGFYEYRKKYGLTN
jgi:hypothetical protein